MTDADAGKRPVARRNLFDACFSGFAQTIVWLLVSLLLAIIVECVGLVYWWPALGLAHSERLYTTEMAYLQTDLRRSVLTADPPQFARGVSSSMHHYLFEATHIVDLVTWDSPTPSSREPRLRANYAIALQAVARFTAAAMQVTQVFSVRLSILLLSLPVFALFGALALIDGLVQRDVRRWSGGRESAFVYHWAKRSTLPLLAMCGVSYLASPFNVHPSMVVLPVAVAFALTVCVTASAFKKYL